MLSWQGKRTIAVVSACMSAHGTPYFAINEVEVAKDEYENGVHYDLVEDRLADAGYEEPYLHFDEVEAPLFLHPAVREYLSVGASPTIDTTEEKP